MEQNRSLSFVSNQYARDVLLEWWKGLENSRGDRAALRRCHNPTEVAFNPAFHRLRMKFKHFGYVNPESLALIAGILSHVRSNNEKVHFAEQMAAPRSGSNNACVSGLRFRRLLKLYDNELFEPLIRIVHMLDGTVNIPVLANSIYWWNVNESTRKEWAFKYYEKAPSES
ncbi:MAG: type I-E CRISPR-associated protein Cse2/CasB [Candidatus Methanoperedens sp.]|nr:type I-E CRISPR-associated protein Cse2/CasB [Candidatus Methanoperedens sp.]